jgi:hypothetical protein
MANCELPFGVTRFRKTLEERGSTMRRNGRRGSWPALLQCCQLAVLIIPWRCAAASVPALAGSAIFERSSGDVLILTVRMPVRSCPLCVTFDTAREGKYQSPEMRHRTGGLQSKSRYCKSACWHVLFGLLRAPRHNYFCGLMCPAT